MMLRIKMLETDLQYQLTDYADRTSSANIERDIFFRELTTHAMYKAQRDRAWEIWTKNPREKFETELAQLVRSGVCNIQNKNGHEYIYMPGFFVQRVREAWSDIENQERLDFPNESRLKFDVPPEMLRQIDEFDIVKFLHHPQKDDLPIIQLLFSEPKLGSTFFLASYAESRLLDAAIAKIRAFLIQKESRGACLARMREFFPDRFLQANTIMDIIIKNPIGCTTCMRSSDETLFLMWKKICEFIVEAASPKAAPPSETEIGIQQGALIIKAYSTYYSELSAQKSQKETLLEDLYAKLAAPPYFRTLPDIYKLYAKNGKTFLEIIGHEEISAFLLKKTQDNSDRDDLPPILGFYDETKQKCFARKEMVLPALSALIASTRKSVLESIKKRWYAISKDYGSEAAMRNDAAFEALLAKTVKRFKPFILILHTDGKMRFLRGEFASAADPNAARLFYGTELKSLTALYNINRHSVMREVTIKLPFWYSIPIFTAIARLFHGNRAAVIDDDDE